MFLYRFSLFGVPKGYLVKKYFGGHWNKTYFLFLAETGCTRKGKLVFWQNMASVYTYLDKNKKDTLLPEIWWLMAGLGSFFNDVHSSFGPNLLQYNMWVWLSTKYNIKNKSIQIINLMLEIVVMNRLIILDLIVNIILLLRSVDWIISTNYSIIIFY